MDPLWPPDEAALDDDEIVRRVRAGEVAQFEVLMRRYNQRLYRVARAILGNDAEVEDVMQETYLRAYSRLGQFAGRARFSTWLTRIAAHEAAARGRRSIRDLFAPFDAFVRASRSGVARDPASPGLDPERRLLQEEARALLERALDALTPDARAVFVLREIEGLDTAETAEVLEVSEEAVRTRLLRARAMLRRELSRRAGIEDAGAYRLHLTRCDRVVRGVLPRLPAGQSAG